MSINVSEEVVSFGDGNALAGIITKPHNDLSKGAAIVIVNSGVLHRVGPCRASVRLGRKAAALGFLTLRFDYSGLGDSGFSGISVDDEESRRCQEILAAFKYIEQQYGISRFVVHGLCSGARDAFNVAVNDRRVVAISQIDSHAYRTPFFYYKKLLPKLIDIGAWTRLFKRATVERFQNNAESPKDEDMATAEWPSYPPQKVIERGYQALMDRQVRCLVVYTGAWAEEYNYENQFYDMYSKVGFGNNLTLCFMPYANHVMTGPGHFDQFFDQFQRFVSDL